MNFIRKFSACLWLWRGSGVLAALCLGLYIYSNCCISDKSEKVYDDVNLVSPAKVGLLLGTGKYVGGGRLNLYYKYRIEAAVELYKAGKIEKIIASGDGGSFEKCEPIQMRDDLVARGVNPDDIIMDYAGFRTLDSVVRCVKIFGQRDVLVISQKFHCERAIYIADSYGLEARGFAAKNVTAHAWKWRNSARESVARLAAFIDVNIGRHPKFYGEKIEIFAAAP